MVGSPYEANQACSTNARAPHKAAAFISTVRKGELEYIRPICEPDRADVKTALKGLWRKQNNLS